MRHRNPADGPALRIYRWAYDRSVSVEPEIVAETRDTPRNREVLRTGGPHAFRSSEYTQDVAVYAFPDREHARTARVEHRNGEWTARHGECILAGTIVGNVNVWDGGTYAKQMRSIAPTPMEVMQSVSAALYAIGEEGTSRWMWSHVPQILPMMQLIADAVARKHSSSAPQATALTLHRGGNQAPALPEFRGYTVFVGHVPLDEIPSHLRPHEHVGGMQGIEVDSPAAAVRVVEHFRDATGMGGSAAPRGFGNVVKWPEGQVIGRVSYNGRYWVPRTPAPAGDPLFLIDRRMEDLVEQAPPFLGSFVQPTQRARPLPMEQAPFPTHPNISPDEMNRKVSDYAAGRFMKGRAPLDAWKELAKHGRDAWDEMPEAVQREVVAGIVRIPVVEAERPSPAFDLLTGRLRPGVIYIRDAYTAPDDLRHERELLRYDVTGPNTIRLETMPYPAAPGDRVNARKVTLRNQLDMEWVADTVRSAREPYPDREFPSAPELGVDKSSHPTVIEYARLEMAKGKSPKAAVSATARNLEGAQNLMLGGDVVRIDRNRLYDNLIERVADHVQSATERVKPGFEYDIAFLGTMEDDYRASDATKRDVLNALQRRGHNWARGVRPQSSR